MSRRYGFSYVLYKYSMKTKFDISNILYVAIMLVVFALATLN